MFSIGTITEISFLVLEFLSGLCVVAGTAEIFRVHTSSTRE